MEVKQKKVEQAPGLACATFLSSWPGLFASCGAFVSICTLVHKQQRLQIRKQALQSMLRKLHLKGSRSMLCAD